MLFEEPASAITRNALVIALGFTPLLLATRALHYRGHFSGKYHVYFGTRYAAGVASCYDFA